MQITDELCQFATDSNGRLAVSAFILNGIVLQNKRAKSSFSFLLPEVVYELLSELLVFLFSRDISQMTSLYLK